MLYKRKDSGQTMIEVVVAFGTAVLVLAAVSVAVLSALQNAQFSKNQKLAENYAIEGIEIARHKRDANYAEFLGYEGNNCLDGDGYWSSMPDGGCEKFGNDIFVRQIEIIRDDDACKTAPTPPGTSGTIAKVTAYVLWSDSKCTCHGSCAGSVASEAEAGNNLYCHKSEVSTCLSDIGVVVPTP